MKEKLRCQQIRAWNCRRVAIGYLNATRGIQYNNLICKGCLETRKRLAIKYPSYIREVESFRPFSEVSA